MHDLRINNQVLHNASGASVKILKVENDKLLLDTFPASSYWSADDISGIPLTTSILRQLSFTNDNKYATWRGQGIGINIMPDGIFYGLRISKSRAKIQYLHQLQNYIIDFYAMFRQKKHSLDISML